MMKTRLMLLVVQLRQNGCQTLLVRCGFLGLLPYRTGLSYPIRFDADHARANPAPIVGEIEFSRPSKEDVSAGS